MSTTIRAWNVIALALLTFVSVSGVEARPAAQARSTPLPALKGVDELKGWFNANQSHPRLVLLVSPT
jgi:hypothetical protein